MLGTSLKGWGCSWCVGEGVWVVELCSGVSGQGGVEVEVSTGMGSLWFFGNGRGCRILASSLAHWDPPFLLALASGRGGSVRGCECGWQSRLQVKDARSAGGGRKVGGGKHAPR